MPSPHPTTPDHEKSLTFFVIPFALGRALAMQALTNVAMAPSTAASGISTSCTTETTPKQVVQIAL